MSVHVRIPTILRNYTEGASEVTAEGATLAEVLDDLEANHNGIRARVLDDAGEIRRFVNVYVGNDDVRFLEGLAAPPPRAPRSASSPRSPGADRRVSRRWPASHGSTSAWNASLRSRRTQWAAPSTTCDLEPRVHRADLREQASCRITSWSPVTTSVGRLDRGRDLAPRRRQDRRPRHAGTSRRRPPWPGAQAPSSLAGQVGCSARALRDGTSRGRPGRDRASVDPLTGRPSSSPRAALVQPGGVLERRPLARGRAAARPGPPAIAPPIE